MNGPQQQPVKYTLEEIYQLRIHKQNEIAESKKRMQRYAQDLFAPQKSANKIDSVMQHINSGISVYDGLMTGMKIVKRIRKFFQGKRSFRT